MGFSRQDEPDREKDKEEVGDEFAQVERTMSKSEEDVSAATATSEGQRTSKVLPFSKARCIALVLTVTGASILNVCYISSYRAC
jgi:hypothetical protein